MTEAERLESGKFLVALAQAVHEECGVKTTTKEAAVLGLRGRNRKAGEMRQAFVFVANLYVPRIANDTIVSVLDIYENTPRNILRRANRRLQSDDTFRAVVTKLCSRFELALPGSKPQP